MKSADMPAMPLSGDAYTDFAGHCYRDESYNPECQGLTKREMISMQCASTMISSKFWQEADKPLIARHAIDMADALIAEWERKCQKP